MSEQNNVTDAVDKIVEILKKGSLDSEGASAILDILKTGLSEPDETDHFSDGTGIYNPDFKIVFTGLARDLLNTVPSDIFERRFSRYLSENTDLSSAQSITPVERKLQLSWMDVKSHLIRMEEVMAAPLFTFDKEAGRFDYQTLHPDTPGYFRLFDGKKMFIFHWETITLLKNYLTTSSTGAEAHHFVELLSRCVALMMLTVIYCAHTVPSAYNTKIPLHNFHQKPRSVCQLGKSEEAVLASIKKMDEASLTEKMLKTVHDFKQILDDAQRSREDCPDPEMVSCAATIGLDNLFSSLSTPLLETGDSILSAIPQMDKTSRGDLEKAFTTWCSTVLFVANLFALTSNFIAKIAVSRDLVESVLHNDASHKVLVKKQWSV